MSEIELDFHDIQGNIVKAYGRYAFPKARYVFFAVRDMLSGRAFLLALAPHVTPSAPWRETGSQSGGRPVPDVTTNVALSYHGLRELGVPRDSLQSFPDEFAMGMRARRDILGDDGVSAPERWDPIWRGSDQVHIFVSIHARDETALELRYQEIIDLADGSAGGVELLTGHRGFDGDVDREDMPYQAATAIYHNGVPSPTEHFGFTDGVSDPYFKGTASHASNVVGGGKVTLLPAEGRWGWRPLETGEFLLGYKDEALELPEAPSPKLLSHNGTFLVYRKLHENVASFDAYLEHVGAEYPGGKEMLAAKLAGRWRNGAPLASFPNEEDAANLAAEWNEAKLAIVQATNKKDRERAKRRFSRLNEQFVAFDYRKDAEGGGCPLGAHVRRANPRSALEFGNLMAFDTPGALSNRRRLIRRGLPYGDSQQKREDGGDHGIIFIALNASIRRQFEFVQQQWINYGNDFRLANDKDPLAGNHGVDAQGHGTGHAVLQTGADDLRPPFFCNKLPRFVETRGGEYFFVPSVTALLMIAEGSIDPT